LGELQKPHSEVGQGFPDSRKSPRNTSQFHWALSTRVVFYSLQSFRSVRARAIPLRSPDKPGQGLAQPSLSAWPGMSTVQPGHAPAAALPCGACGAHAAETLDESGTHKPRAHVCLRGHVVVACPVPAAANAACMSVVAGAGVTPESSHASSDAAAFFQQVCSTPLSTVHACCSLADPELASIRND